MGVTFELSRAEAGLSSFESTSVAGGWDTSHGTGVPAGSTTQGWKVATIRLLFFSGAHSFGPQAQMRCLCRCQIALDFQHHNALETSAYPAPPLDPLVCLSLPKMYPARMPLKSATFKKMKLRPRHRPRRAYRVSIRSPKFIGNCLLHSQLCHRR